MTEPYPHAVDIMSCCRHLRTKMQHCALADMQAGPGYVRVSDTATYWCNRTAASFGPDDAPGTPHTCQPGRICFVPAE